MHPFVIQHRQDILDVLSRYKLSNPIVFGSMARGDASDDSDLDLLVEMPKGMKFMRFVEAHLDLEDTLGTKVDLGTREMLDARFRDYILRDAKPL